jgi:hypothetical protein
MTRQQEQVNKYKQNTVHHIAIIITAVMMTAVLIT